MLEGLLVDLVPFGDEFKQKAFDWKDASSWYWGSMGNRWFATRAGVERHQREHAEREGPRYDVPFGIRTKDGKPLGFIGINWMVPHHRLAMLGAMIHEPAYWGGGYGTDALLLIVDHAFDWLDVHKVWLFTMGLNVRVHRQMEKVGFRQEARQRQATWADGVWDDGVAFGLLRDEWPGRLTMLDRLNLQAR